MSVHQQTGEAAPPREEQPDKRPRDAHARRWNGRGWGFIVKLVVMMIVNAAGLAAIISALRVESWVILAVLIVLLVAADVVYFWKRAMPLKYLLPGLVFLFAFQIFIFGYTAYIAFTNYGTGHNVTQDQAVEAALIQGERRVEGSPTYPLAVVERGLGGGGGAALGHRSDRRSRRSHRSTRLDPRRPIAPAQRPGPAADRGRSACAGLRRSERRRHPLPRRIERRGVPIDPRVG